MIIKENEILIKNLWVPADEEQVLHVDWTEIRLCR